MTDHLFVYGSLAPGKSNAHVLAGIAGSWQPARAKGSLLQAAGAPRSAIRASCCGRMATG